MTIKTETSVTAANQTADALACEDGILVQVGERDLASPPGSDKAYGVAAVYGRCAVTGLTSPPWVLLNRFNFPGMYQDFFYAKTDVRVVIESLTFGGGATSTKVIVVDTK